MKIQFLAAVAALALVAVSANEKSSEIDPLQQGTGPNTGPPGFARIRETVKSVQDEMNKEMTTLTTKKAEVEVNVKKLHEEFLKLESAKETLVSVIGSHQQNQQQMAAQGQEKKRAITDFLKKVETAFGDAEKFIENDLNCMGTVYSCQSCMTTALEKTKQTLEKQKEAKEEFFSKAPGAGSGSAGVTPKQGATTDAQTPNTLNTLNEPVSFFGLRSNLEKKSHHLLKRGSGGSVAGGPSPTMINEAKVKAQAAGAEAVNAIFNEFNQAIDKAAEKVKASQQTTKAARAALDAQLKTLKDDVDRIANEVDELASQNKDLMSDTTGAKWERWHDESKKFQSPAILAKLEAHSVGFFEEPWCKIACGNCMSQTLNKVVEAFKQDQKAETATH